MHDATPNFSAINK